MRVNQGKSDQAFTICVTVLGSVLLVLSTLYMTVCKSVLYCVQYYKSFVWENGRSTLWYCYLFPESVSDAVDILSRTSQSVVTGICEVPLLLIVSSEERLDPSFCSMLRLNFRMLFFKLDILHADHITEKREKIRRPRCVKTTLCVFASPAFNWRYDDCA